jgi:hypothetical protein
MAACERFRVTEEHIFSVADAIKGEPTTSPESPSPDCTQLADLVHAIQAGGRELKA